MTDTENTDTTATATVETAEANNVVVVDTTNTKSETETTQPDVKNTKTDTTNTETTTATTTESSSSSEAKTESTATTATPTTTTATTTTTTTPSNEDDDTVNTSSSSNEDEDDMANRTDNSTFDDDSDEDSDDDSDDGRSLFLEVPDGPYINVKDIGFAEEANYRHRRHMEDGHAIVPELEPKSSSYFGIYDGHGGKHAVDYIQGTLHERLKTSLASKKPKTAKEVQDCISGAYATVDDELKQTGQAQYNGATIATVLIRNEGNKRICYSSNAGDARVTLCRGTTAKRLTYDHKASDDDEQKRIKDAHGFVAYNRVNGILAVARALGDHAMKKWIIGTPFHSVEEIQKTDKFIIIACDGIWDVLSDQEAVNIVLKFDNAQAASDALIKSALQNGTTDNISVIVVFL